MAAGLRKGKRNEFPRVTKDTRSSSLRLLPAATVISATEQSVEIFDLDTDHG